jgi:enamine deaminase RidA (YjgF/YER057c/UK114 family)
MRSGVCCGWSGLERTPQVLRIVKEMSIQISNPNTVASPDGHFSQSVVVSTGAKMIYISGQVPRNLAGDTVGIGDMTAQAEQVFSNLGAILAAHGSSFDNAVKATIFVTDISRSGEVADVRSRHYGAATPASTFVEVSALGNPDWLLEVEMVAVV